MKKIFKTLAVAAAVLLGLPSASFAQVLAGNEPQRPSTEVWESVHYGKVSPTLYTGTVNLSIPFYTYEDPDFNIPISFNYASNGILPNDHPGSLGVGWNLSVGGSITREIRGIPDDTMATLEITNLNNVPIYGYRYVSENNLTFLPSAMYVGSRPGEAGSMITYYYDSVNNKHYDAEPDIFHFNFMGYSGSFRFNADGSTCFYDTSESPKTFRIETAFPYNSGSAAGITIQTADGYRYEFDGITSGQNGDADWYYHWGTTILTWRLSRIVAPSGRVAAFTYQSGPDVYSRRPNSLCLNMIQNSGYPEDIGTATIYNNEKALAVQDIVPHDLTAIKIDGAERIVFSYETTTEKSYLTAQEVETSFLSQNGHRRLTGIRVHDGERTIKTAAFTYDAVNKAQRSFLKTISISGIGSYSMDYYNTSALPMFGTFKVDHWGYFNNLSSASTFLKVSSLNNNYLDETLTSGSVRTPNANYARCGILTKITYPTGGWSSFTYEAHTYAKAVRRTAASDFAPFVESSTGIAGGVRIAAIEDFGSDGTSLYKRQYSYTIGTSSQSSGVLVWTPRYQIHFSTGIANYTSEGTMWSNSLTHYGSTHIEYSHVLETRKDGSAVRYHFTTSQDYPDLLEYEDIYPERKQGLSGGSEWSSVGLVRNLFMNTSRQHKRGVLKQKDYLNGSSVIGSDTYTQTTAIYFPEFYYAPQYLFFAVGVPGTDITWNTLGSETISRTFGSQTVSAVTTYFFNSAGLRSAQVITGSRGEKQITRWTYVSDHGSDAATSMYRKMYDAGQIDAPVTEAVYTVPAGSTTETLVKRRTWTYLQPSASVHPSMFRAATITDYDGQTGKNFVTTFVYSTNNGRLLQKTDQEGTKTTYVWGYGGLYPVARVVGAAYTQLMSISGLSGIVNTALSGGLTAAQATALRALPGAEATVWEYSPLVGLTKETTPDGRSTSYSYNASGKLHQVLDDLGRTTGAYLYSTDNKQQ